MAEKKGLLTGNALKWIAIVTMLIDHVGATLVLQMFYANPTNDMLAIYYLVRSVGRVAFPIFCFLLVEGFCHTRSRGKYLLRLGLFALLAEIPFDLAFNWPEYSDLNVFGILEFTSQNVFFTLFFGLCALWLWDVMAKRLPRWAEYAAAVVAALPACFAANLLCTDYDVSGVALIVALGIGRGLPYRRAEPGAPSVPVSHGLSRHFGSLLFQRQLDRDLCHHRSVADPALQRQAGPERQVVLLHLLPRASAHFGRFGAGAVLRHHRTIVPAALAKLCGEALISQS